MHLISSAESRVSMTTILYPVHDSYISSIAETQNEVQDRVGICDHIVGFYPPYGGVCVYAPSGYFCTLDLFDSIWRLLYNGFSSTIYIYILRQVPQLPLW